MGEFELIRRHFQRQRPARADVPLGIGDDCALLSPEPGQQLAVSTDMLVEGRHFLSTVDPAALGHKALAVNLSDLAACGAKPVAFTLALALPRVDEAFLAGLAQGLFDLAYEIVGLEFLIRVPADDPASENHPPRGGHPVGIADGGFPMRRMQELMRAVGHDCS